MQETFKIDGILIATFLLVFVTIWYAWATDKMRKMMKRDYDLKTKPLLEFKPASISANDWQSLTISQTIVNTGLSFAIVERAQLLWKLQMERTFENTVNSDHNLPLYIAPGTTAIFSFAVPDEELKKLPHGTLSSASKMIEGMIEYEYRGIDNILIKRSEKPNLD